MVYIFHVAFECVLRAGGGEGVNLGTNRMGRKVKQESNKKEPIFERSTREICQNGSAPVCLAQAFEPHQEDLFLP